MAATQKMTYEELQAIHPLSDLKAILMLENGELHELAYACRVVYVGISERSKVSVEPGNFRGDRMSLIKEILTLRAKHLQRTQAERAMVLVED